MAEYIEREKLLEIINSRIEVLRKEYGDFDEYTDGIDECIDRIEDFPAADVAPVVRCRDCKHAWIHPCGYVYCHRDGRNAYEMTFNLDSFCSYGERKDNG